MKSRLILCRRDLLWQYRHLTPREITDKHFGLEATISEYSEVVVQDYPFYIVLKSDTEPIGVQLEIDFHL